MTYQLLALQLDPEGRWRMDGGGEGKERVSEARRRKCSREGKRKRGREDEGGRKGGRKRGRAKEGRFGPSNEAEEKRVQLY